LKATREVGSLRFPFFSGGGAKRDYISGVMSIVIGLTVAIAFLSLGAICFTYLVKGKD
jgi:hypothetical protein